MKKFQLRKKEKRQQQQQQKTRKHNIEDKITLPV